MGPFDLNSSVSLSTMEEPEVTASLVASTPSSSSSESMRRGGYSGAASSSSSSSQVLEEEEGEQEGGGGAEDRDRESELERQLVSATYWPNRSLRDELATMVRDDSWSCAIVILTFWFFVAMTLILGVFGSVRLRLGPNCSLLIQANPLFVQFIKVEELSELKSGPKLYGFYNPPPLDVITSWSETHKASLPSDSSKEWIYFLNEGSQLNISFNVKSPSALSVLLVIAQGNEGLAQWLEDPSYPNTTLSWNIIHGTGMIGQDILSSSSYYVAVANLNPETVKVQLNLSTRAFVYNTSEAYYKCNFARDACSLKLLFPRGNAAVLTSPMPEQGTPSDEWYVRLSYGPRWTTYIIGIGGMTLLMSVVFSFLNKFQRTHEDRIPIQSGEMRSERAPLLPQKDDDTSSVGSSYDSASRDEEDPENGLADGENDQLRRICVICFDAPRDCFFLPCGHCVACFTCGTRIAEAAGTCPICRRKMKKVKKILTV